MWWAIDTVGRCVDHPGVRTLLSFSCTTTWLWKMPLCAALAALAACGRPADAPQQNFSGTEAHDATDAIVARIGGRIITASQADAPLQLALHDLEMQKYRLRRKALETEVLRAFEASPDGEPVAEIMLVPPVPPRVIVEVDPARIRPSQDAPVTVLAFCNFESPHCARLQVTLSQVLPLFPGVVRYAERDLPLAFHRHAGQAAQAARCAADQGNYWRFHDQLYATTDAPDRAALDRAMRAANLELNVFAQCRPLARHWVKTFNSRLAARIARSSAARSGASVVA